MSFVRANTQVLKLYLRLRPGEIERALKRLRAAVLIGEVQDLLAIRSDKCGKGNARGGPRQNVHRAPQTKNGVEYGTCRIREWPSVDDRNRAGDIVATSKKPRAVRLALRFIDAFAFQSHHVRGPDNCFFVGLPAACRKQRADIRHKFSLDK